MLEPRRSAALVAALVACIPQLASGQTASTATGVFHVTWGDPSTPGESFRQYTLGTDDRGTLLLELDESLTRPWGGPTALHGRRVTLELDPTPAVAADPVPGRAARAQPVRVRGLRPVDAVASALALEGTASFGALSAATESLPYVTILCRFSDHPEVEPAAPSRFDSIMGGAAYPGTSHFWAENSDGAVDMAGSITVGWYTLPHPQSYYAPGWDDANLNALTEDCTAVADADVHFPDFAGINLQFNWRLGCCSWGGGRYLTLDGVAKGYAMTWMADWAATSPGVYAHEVGHTLGLPHSSGPYGFVYDSRWDVMSDASWFVDPALGMNVGVQTIAFHKDRLGWIPAHRRVVAEPGETTVLLERHALPGENDNARVVIVPIRGYQLGYYTLEARRRAGYDTPLASEGVVMHLIAPGVGEARVVDVDANGDPSDAGSWLDVGEVFYDWDTGVHIAVEEQVGDAYRVRVRLPEFTAAHVDTTTHEHAVPFAVDATIADSVAVEVTGPEAASLPWTAAAFGAGTTLLERSGTGPGMIRWTHRMAGYQPGAHLVFIAVSAGARTYQVVSRVTVSDPGTAALSTPMPVRRDTVFAGSQAIASRNIMLSGPGADTMAWSLSTDVPWLLPDSTAGRGPAAVDVNYDAAALAPGLHVGHITVVAPGAAGSPLIITDSLRVLAPVAIAVERASTSARSPQEGPLVLDSVYVRLTGEDAEHTSWSAWGTSASSIYLSPAPGPHRGSKWLTLRRRPAYLPVGAHENTLVITTVARQPVRLEAVDTLHIDEAAPAIFLARGGGRDSVVIGFAPAMDSVDVQPIGAGTATMKWQGSGPMNGHILPLERGVEGLPGGGAGPGRLVWLRNMNGREPGMYVDTIRVRFMDGGIAVPYVDTLMVLGQPRIEAGAAERRGEARWGAGTTLQDSVAITLSGWQADAIAWTATRSAPWITLQTPGATGSGVIRWTRDPAGLAPGTYTDTIAVTTADPVAGGPLAIVDVLVVRPPVVIVSDSARPPGIMGAPYADSLETDVAAPAARWRVLDGALPPGVALDSVSGRIAGIPEAAGDYRFTVRLDTEFDDDRPFRIVVTRPVVDGARVFDRLLGGNEAALSADHARFLDLLGNRNGRLDIGDVRGWLNDPDTPAAASAAFTSRSQETPR